MDRPGAYRFEVRRRPHESGPALTDACGETQLTDGEASDVFERELEAGQTLLHTGFDDARGQPIGGAYYVYVERLC